MGQRYLIVLHRKYVCTATAETMLKYYTIGNVFSLVPGKR